MLPSLVALPFILTSCIVQPAPRDTPLKRKLLAPPSLEQPTSDGGVLLANRYDFDAWIYAHDKAHNPLPKHAIMISMSGGATRAAALAQSVLLALGQFKLPTGTLADDVIAISAVSGGAMTAAAFVLDRAECPASDTFVCDIQALGLRDPQSHRDSIFDQKILQANLLGQFLADIPQPWVWPDRAQRWQEFFDDYFRDAYPKHEGTFTYADLGANPKLPFLILNSSDVLNDRTFSFVQYQFNDICADLNRLPLSVGLAAAGNFPFLSSDIELRNFRAVAPCGNSFVLDPETDALTVEMENPYGAPVEAGGPSEEPWAFGSRYSLENATLARYRLAMRNVTPQSTHPPHDGSDPARRVDWVHLYDGGVVDDLGLWPLVRLLDKTRLKALASRGVEDITIIALNARWDWKSPRNLKDGSPYFTQLFLDTGLDPINQAMAINEEFDLASLAAEYRDLCPQGTLGASSCSQYPAAIYPVVIDFDQLVGKSDLVTLREEVKNFGDDQSLGDPPPKHLHANRTCLTKLCVIARAGRQLLARNPCFQALVSDVGAVYRHDELDAYPGPSLKSIGAHPTIPACKKIIAEQ